MISDQRKSIKESKIMSSCAAYGAVAAYLKMNDVAVVLHGPLSCAYLMDTARSKAVLDLYDDGIYASKPNHNLRCTMMDDSSSIFGGIGKLEKTLRDTLEEGFMEIAVVTTCMPGIIGDDCLTAIDRLAQDYPEANISYIPADGDINGEFTDGFMLAVENITKMFDTSLERERGFVNIIGSSFFDIHSVRHAKEMKEIFSRLGLRENCRFLDETTSKAVEGFCRGHMDMMINDTASTREMASIIEKNTGRKALSAPLPIGLYDYQRWLRQIGEIMGTEVESEIERAGLEQTEFLEAHRHHFSGKKMILMNRSFHNIDWLIDMLIGLEVNIVRIGRTSSPRKGASMNISRYSNITTSDYDTDDLKRDLEHLGPDVLISDLAAPMEGRCRSARVGKIGLGIRSTMEYIEYLENIMRLPKEEGWKGGRKI